MNLASLKHPWRWPDGAAISYVSMWPPILPAPEVALAGICFLELASSSLLDPVLPVPFPALLPDPYHLWGRARSCSCLTPTASACSCFLWLRFCLPSGKPVG